MRLDLACFRDVFERLTLAVGFLAISAMAAGAHPSAAAEDTTGADLEFEPHTVTGRERDTTASRPYRTRVTDRGDLDRAVSNNILDVLDRQPGLFKQIDCSVCNTAQIRLLGLNGAYTQVLVDGVPSHTGLSMIHGIEQIPLANIERIEVIQGVGSVRHGGNAVAGIINIVTARPGPVPEANVSVRYGDSNEQDYQASYSGMHGGKGVQFSFAKHSSPQINSDGNHVYDVAEFDRSTFSGRLSVPLGSRVSLFYAFQAGSEERFGGTVSSSRRWIGDFQPESTFTDGFGQTVTQPLIYQEYVQSRRVSYETGYTAHLDGGLVQSSRINFTEHYQNGYYGYQHLEAKQRLLFVENDWTWYRPRHEISLGASYQDDSFRDNRSLGNHSHRVPALYAQDIWNPADDWRVLAGVRGDFHNVHGLLFSPRAGLHYGGIPELGLRINAGAGFRTFNLFSEDHAAVTTALYVPDPLDGLDAERSWSVVTGAEWFPLARTNTLWNVVLDASAYQTWITGFIQPRYLPEFTVDGRQRVRYENLDGRTVARGLQLTGELTSPFGLEFDGGINLLDNYNTRSGEQTRLYNTPRHTASLAASQTFARTGTTLLADAAHVGPQRLREVRFGPPPESGPDDGLVQPERESESYRIFNAGIEQRLGAFVASLSVRNIGDFYQARREPVFYSHEYNVITNSVFAPLKGRSIHLGIRGRFQAGNF